MVGTIKWTEEKIEAMRAEGYGFGTGADYLPWLHRLSFSSHGRCRSTGVSPKTGRVHELFSDAEYDFFLCLERDRSVTDIREQFPLDRDVTQDVARSLGIAHPMYPRTNTPTVMTVDFMVTKLVNRERQLMAFNVKPASEIEDARSVAKLEIQRAALWEMKIPHKLVLDTMMSRELISKLEWIRRPCMSKSESVPYPDYWNEWNPYSRRHFLSLLQAFRSPNFASALIPIRGWPPGLD
ncbi:TnsA endonuclease N-terminal domain-containing protein [Oxalobacteraceae bacterium OTU3CINTB1]|nr:TnsA endonuclease N-terminal domain-containing protein [Oxalobacteraceae bacterium OTU3CINTB1]